jgi:hypothetical protein
MAYILDDKKDLGSFVIPIGATPTVTSFNPTQIQNTFAIGPDNLTKYTFPTTPAPGAGYILQDVGGTGILTWELVSASASYSWKRITDSGTNYNVLLVDDGIEIVSNTYNTVTLPTAVGSGGKKYVISRVSNNNNLLLMPQVGETIDSYPNFAFTFQYTRVSVISNDVNGWYII